MPKGIYDYRKRHQNSGMRAWYARGQTLQLPCDRCTVLVMLPVRMNGHDITTIQGLGMKETLCASCWETVLAPYRTPRTKRAVT